MSLALAAAGVRVLLQDQPGEGSSGGGSNDQEREYTARLMDAPAGQLLVGLVGAVVLGVGLYQVVRAVRRTYLKRVDLTCMGPRVPQKVLEVLGLAGHIGRALLFVVVGGFLVKAAAVHEADEGRGIDGSLHELSTSPFGRVLLLITALGVVCFGLWVLVEARCRRSDT